MKNPVIRYVRNSLGEPFACVVAIEDPEYGYAIGWSQCNPADQFRKSVARDLALHRAKYGVKPRSVGGLFQVYPEPSTYNDPMYGRVNWAFDCLYVIHIIAEERFAPVV